MLIPEWIVIILIACVGICAVFGGAFAVPGAGVLDPGARHSGWLFRAFLFPVQRPLGPHCSEGGCHYKTHAQGAHHKLDRLADSSDLVHEPGAVPR